MSSPPLVRPAQTLRPLLPLRQHHRGDLAHQWTVSGRMLTPEQHQMTLQELSSGKGLAPGEPPTVSKAGIKHWPFGFRSGICWLRSSTMATTPHSAATSEAATRKHVQAAARSVTRVPPETQAAGRKFQMRANTDLTIAGRSAVVAIIIVDQRSPRVEMCCTGK